MAITPLQLLEFGQAAFERRQDKKALSFYLLYQSLTADSLLEADIAILRARLAHSGGKADCRLKVPVFANRQYLLEKFYRICQEIAGDALLLYRAGAPERSCLEVYLNLSETGYGALRDFLARTKLFDAGFYCRQYSLALTRAEAIAHYVDVGLENGYLCANWFELLPGAASYPEAREFCSSSQEQSQALPKVSVVLPVYNNEAYIDECLESVLGQTLAELEIIIVNDGSTSALTNARLAAYAKRDKRVLLLNKKNTGYGHSCNCGIHCARGKYLAIVESDDYILPDMYATLYALAEAHQAEVVKCNYRTFTGAGSQREYQDIDIDQRYHDLVVNPQENPDILRAPNIVINQPSITSLEFIRKNRILFNESPGASFQDIGVFWKRYFYARKIYYCNQYFYMLRRDKPDSSSVSRGKVLAHAAEYALVEAELRRQPSLEKKFITYLQNKKLGSTEWHLTRVDPRNRQILLEYIAREYNLALQQREIDDKLISPARISNYNAILNQYGAKRKSVVIYIRELLYGGLERSAAILSFALRDLGFDVYFMVDEESKSSYAYFGTIHKFTFSQTILNILAAAEYIFDFKFKNGKRDSFVAYCLKHFASKYIVTIHSSGDRVKFYYDLIKFYLDKYNFSINDLYRVVCCGAVVKQAFEKKYGQSERTEILYNSFIPVPVAKNRQDLPSRYILFVGRKNATEVKGLDVLIRAYLASDMPVQKIRLILAGNGELDESLKALVNDSDYPDCLLELNFVSNIELYYANAICTVLPSRSEGFSMTIVESLAYGTPVLAANVGGASEVINHSFNGYLFEKGRIADLTYYLNTIIYSAGQMRQFCPKSVEKFSFSSYTRALSVLLQKPQPQDKSAP